MNVLLGPRRHLSVGLCGVGAFAMPALLGAGTSLWWAELAAGRRLLGASAPPICAAPEIARAAPGGCIMLQGLVLLA
ncbi:MAG: hypothetical protein ABSH51_09095 [Solirubrobacteraceae bacterium]